MATPPIPRPLPEPTRWRRGYVEIQRAESFWTYFPLGRYYWKIRDTGIIVKNSGGFAYTKKGALKKGTREMDRQEKHFARRERELRNAERIRV